MSKQTYGEVLCKVIVDNIREDKARELWDAIKKDQASVRYSEQASFDRGSNNRGTMVLWAYYGPVLGGWSSDVRDKFKKLLKSVGTTADLIVHGSRHRIATREEYDRAVQEDRVEELNAQSFMRTGAWRLP